MPVPPPFAYSRVFERPEDLYLAFLRDIDADLEFVIAETQGLANRAPRSLAEVQCGPALYARRFAESGQRAVAIDTSRAMLDHAKGLPRGERLELHLQDPRALAIDPVDVVLFPLDSFAYFTSDDDVLAFFSAAERCLTPKGVLFIEANHPKEAGYIDYGVVYPRSLTEDPRRAVRAEWAVNHPKFDWVTGINQSQVRITVTTAGIAQTRTIDSTERVYWPAQLRLLAEKSPLRIVAFHGGWTDRPLDWDSPVQVFTLMRATERA